ncbi:dTDP-4-amino-4,6-dideoxygalactose transaminase [Mannheimia sp. AT1]|uniref:dTDP-4-amino-4,6-dideoxygalactose transaminase n=1 Tax=Mannheimia cairinae TaxID=3025936 RepID=A0ABT5MS13_9PAST|nr:dTDP-4-amino-4,6-dideoxygalactose transaminase [Mannheimia cairinae]MDD0824969.1 dTDP-4-amino-4,6-dideoxygalactose transaminase [Mannheimia cairinae]MDD0827207.1 dTDP-4-amino-4,6-dideoxygalactose transaminase [Mannheimia cairinae]
MMNSHFIPFNQPPVVGTELDYIHQAITTGRLSGGGKFSSLCEQWLEQNLEHSKVLLVPSCTAALEMAAMLLDIQAGDEIIMPSYTFVSSANAFVLRGAKIVFVDIRPDTMNLDEKLLEQAITTKTKAIVPVHYAGLPCEMNTIMAVAEKYGLYVIEDAAQGVMSFYNGKALGSIGHIGCYSFHETKNYSAGGEGGAIIINDPKLIERAEIIREKGTDRHQFFRGEVDKYRWQDIGSSFLMSEIQAAYLYAQLDAAEHINHTRQILWQRYYQAFKPFGTSNFQLPSISSNCLHNGHLFYLKLRDLTERTAFIEFMKARDILTVFHYIPLHTSPAGKKYGRFVGEDKWTTRESERLVRLPLFYNLTEQAQNRVIKAVCEFLKKQNG